MSAHIPLRLLCASVLLHGLASAQVVLNHLVEIDVTSAGMGNNPSAVAWDGSDLYLAGFNGSTTAQSVAIVRIQNVLGAPVVGAPFGVQAATPSNRGYISLDIDRVNGRVTAAYDPGASSPQGIACYDQNGNLLWSKAARGSNGAAFDPGFPGGMPALGTGVGWCNFGQPGRALQDAAVGSDIWDLNTGMTVLLNGQNGNIRDLDFDDRSGDVYLRAANNVFRGVRTGDNSCTLSLLVDAVDAPLVALQNVAVISTGAATTILYNDRASGGVGQLFGDVIKAVRPDGTPEVVDYGSFAPAASAAAYDFSWDGTTQTLALVDYLTRKVHIFGVQVQSAYPFGQGCAGQGNFVPVLSASGLADHQNGGLITYSLTDAAPTALVFFMLGFNSTQIPFGNGCDLLITPVLPRYLGPFFTPPGSLGSGTATAALAVPAGFGGLNLTTQGLVLELVNNNALVFSNGVFLRVGR